MFASPHCHRQLAEVEHWLQGITTGCLTDKELVTAMTIIEEIELEHKVCTFGLVLALVDCEG